MGRARLGMIVADVFLRNRKMMSTTRARAMSRVICTSLMECLMDTDRSYRMLSFTEAGICFWNSGRTSLTALTTSTVLVPG